MFDEAVKVKNHPKLYARVVVVGAADTHHDSYGQVVNVRRDNNGRDIYTVNMEKPGVGDEGQMVARKEELIFV